MRAADGIAAYLLHGFQTAQPHLVGHSHSKASCVLMKTHAFQFHVLSVEPEASVGIEADVAKAEGSDNFVGQAAARVFHLCHKAVHHRRVAAPKSWIVHLHLLRSRGSHLLAVRTKYHVGHLCPFVALCLCLHHNSPVGLCHHIYSVCLHPRGSRCFYPYMAIDARTGVPSRLLLPVYMHHESVVSLLIYIRCKVEIKAGIAIHVVSKTMAVEPYRGTMINSVEGYCHPLLCSHRRRQRKVLHINALSTGEITSRAAHLRVERQKAAPVVRHADSAEFSAAHISLHGRGGHFPGSHLSLFRLGVVGHLVYLSILLGGVGRGILHP